MRKNKDFAKGFLKGQESIFRKNPSGCCCLFDKDDRVIELCGAHIYYFETLYELEKKKLQKKYL